MEMQITTKEFEKRVQQTVREWKLEGNKPHPAMPNMPYHPGYVYRMQGNDWKWTDIDLNPENVLQDAIEDEAWKRINN
jgi:hypothetical protein